MTRSPLVFAALVLSSILGCAAPLDPQADTGSVATSSSALVTDASYPARVDHALGASREDICAAEDADTKAAFARYRTAKGKAPGAWVMEGDVYTCRFCDLDGQTISSPTNKIRIEDSTAKGATFQASGDDWQRMMLPYTVQLQNVYARGATFGKAVAFVQANHADLRCASGGMMLGASPEMFDQAPGELPSKDVDLSGSAFGTFATYSASDLRLTGSHVDQLQLTNKLEDARLDNITTSQPIHLSQLVAKGKIAFDRTPALALETYMADATFDGATLSFNGSRGTIAPSGGAITLKDVTLDGLDGNVRLAGDLSRFHLSGVKKWPVGRRGLVDDASLRALDLSGATLETEPGEIWPQASPLVLDGLRLTHGAFPARADLSRVSLKDAKLERVVFKGIALSDGKGHAAVLDGASLSRAIFDAVSLDGVSFVGADVRGASFSVATGSATFDRAKAGRLPPHTDDNDTDRSFDTSFEGAILGSSTFVEAQLQHTLFRGASVSTVDFSDATADWADFTSAHLHDAQGNANQTLAKVKSLRGVTFDQADARGVNLSGVDMSPADGQAASFKGTFLCGANLSHSKLHGANLTSVFFDVDGDVRFSDKESGPCRPGPHDGVDTSSTGTAVTSCPAEGLAPAGAAGQCTEAQWKIEGACPSDPSRRPKISGRPCDSRCDCESLVCRADGTCA